MWRVRWIGGWLALWLMVASAWGTSPTSQALNTPVLMVADQPVGWDEFYFWLRHAARHYKRLQGLPEDEPLRDWQALQPDGLSLREHLLAQAQTLARQSRAMAQQAQAHGLSLSAQELAAIEAEQMRQIRIYSDAEYQRIVARMYGSQAVLTRLSRLDLLGQRLFAQLYGARGERCSDAEVAAYVAQAQLVYVKYLFVPRSTPQAEALVRALRARLDGAKDPDAVLTAAIRDHGDDAMQDEPDGRLLARNRLPTPLAAVHDTLPEGGFSSVLDSPEGFYLMQRLPITPDVSVAGHSLRYWAAYHHLFRPAVARWAQTLPAQWLPAVEGVNVEKLGL